MIYFIEHDSAENIFHVCADPGATIVPLINRVTFKKPDGTPNNDASGNPLSPANLPLLDPVGIDFTTYTLLMKEGMNKYTYDQATKTVVKKAVSPNV